MTVGQQRRKRLTIQHGDGAVGAWVALRVVGP